MVEPEDGRATTVCTEWSGLFCGRRRRAPGNVWPVLAESIVVVVVVAVIVDSDVDSANRG